MTHLFGLMTFWMCWETLSAQYLLLMRTFPSRTAAEHSLSWMSPHEFMNIVRVNTQSGFKGLVLNEVYVCVQSKWVS